MQRHNGTCVTQACGTAVNFTLPVLLPALALCAFFCKVAISAVSRLKLGAVVCIILPGSFNFNTDIEISGTVDTAHFVIAVFPRYRGVALVTSKRVFCSNVRKEYCYTLPLWFTDCYFKMASGHLGCRRFFKKIQDWINS